MTEEFVVDGLFEARLVRENKSAKGIFLTLELAADDYFAAKLSDVRPGALLKIGYQEIVDVSVQPIEVEQADPTKAIPVTAEQLEKLYAPKPKKRFEDLPLVQQAGMRCAEPDFRRFLEAYMGVTPGSASEDVAAALVRDFCRVESRADLDRLPEAGNCWRVLESSFQRYLLDQRYPAGARR